MGILADGLSIIFGVFIGNVFKRNLLFKNITVFGISIMLLSIVGFVENVFLISDMSIKSGNIILIVFSLIVGNVVGSILKLEERMSRMSDVKDDSAKAIIDATMFFGIGGLQISGAILLAIKGDNSQLLLKSLVDFPFALMFGITFGLKASLSAIPVCLCQIGICAIAHFSQKVFSGNMINGLCAMGYIILFFSGYNLVCETKHKISTVNMLPGMLILIIFNLITELRGMFI